MRTAYSLLIAACSGIILTGCGQVTPFTTMQAVPKAPEVTCCTPGDACCNPDCGDKCCAPERIKQPSAACCTDWEKNTSKTE
jgi:hypothetical protein